MAPVGPDRGGEWTRGVPPHRLGERHVGVVVQRRAPMVVAQGLQPVAVVSDVQDSFQDDVPAVVERVADRPEPELPRDTINLVEAPPTDATQSGSPRRSVAGATPPGVPRLCFGKKVRSGVRVGGRGIGRQRADAVRAPQPSPSMPPIRTA